MAATTAVHGRMGRATLASVTIHVLAALAIPALAWTVSTATPVETVSFMHVLRVAIVPPMTPKPPRAVAPHHDIKAATNLAAPAPRVGARPHRNTSHATVVATNVSAAPSVGAVQRAGASSDGNAAPNATPSPVVRSVSSLGARQTGGYLPFGAEQPVPVLDPSVRKQLDALGTHVTLVVTVGDDGRTKNVAFEPPIDPQLEDRIRSLLADASWDPAVCGGGVSCEAHATIQL